MKLINETTLGVKLLTEEKNGAKNYFIEGVFMQSETKNRNGRIYPAATLACNLRVSLSSLRCLIWYFDVRVCVASLEI